MRETIVANRYAKALFELSIEMNLVEQIYKDNQLVLEVCNQNPEFIIMLRSPVIKDRKKLSIIREIFEKKIHELTFKFMAIITKNSRESLLAEIARQFIAIYKEFKNIVPAHLATAATIDAETRNTIIALLEDRTDTTIELTEEIKEDLIGGFVLTMQDKQYDASVLTQIKNLRKDFKVNLYVKGF
ncbi:MAG: ATP synthase F1 subunit delta [Bacteroidales bacterium]